MGALQATTQHIETASPRVGTLKLCKSSYMLQLKRPCTALLLNASTYASIPSEVSSPPIVAQSLNLQPTSHQPALYLAIKRHYQSSDRISANTAHVLSELTLNTTVRHSKAIPLHKCSVI